MHKETQHNMERTINIIKQQQREGDLLISGELYTFLDGSYYLGDKNLKLLSKPVDGYGETSLFYDQQTEYLVNDNKELGNRVWVLGKSGEKEYFSPSNWPGYEPVTYFEEQKNNGLKVVLFERR